MNKALWELAAVVFILSVLTYGAWTMRYYLGDVFFLFMGLALVVLLIITVIEVRHRHRLRELEYLRMSHIVHSEVRVIESDSSNNIAMIEPPRQHWANPSWDIEPFEPMESTEIEPVPPVVPHVEHITKEISTLTRAQNEYKAGAKNRESLAASLKVTNRRARQLIAKLKEEKRI